MACPFHLDIFHHPFLISPYTIITQHIQVHWPESQNQICTSVMEKKKGNPAGKPGNKLVLHLVTQDVLAYSASDGIWEYDYVRWTIGRKTARQPGNR